MDNWTVEDDLVIRKADITDREVVLGIHDNVFNGSDYLAYRYNIFCHSKLYLMYIAEAKGVAVSIYIYIYITSIIYPYPCISVVPYHSCNSRMHFASKPQCIYVSIYHT